MSIIYSFLQKRRMRESQHGYIMIIIAYVLSALMMIMGSDVLYNIKSSAAGMNDNTQEETQDELNSKLYSVNMDVYTARLTNTTFVNPYGLTNTVYQDSDTNETDQAIAGTSSGISEEHLEDTSSSTDTIWLLGSAMNEDIFDKAIQKLGSLDIVKETEKKVKEKKVSKVAKSSSRPDTRSKYGNISSNEVAMLQRIVQAEAGGEDMKGKILIANVIMNRVKSSKFPRSIKGVIFQQKNGRYQFSPVGNKRYWSVRVSSATKEAVRRALKGEDYSQGALYFVARSKTTASKMKWFDNKLNWLFKHGGHEFYKNK